MCVYVYVYVYVIWICHSSWDAGLPRLIAAAYACMCMCVCVRACVCVRECVNCMSYICECVCVCSEVRIENHGFEWLWGPYRKSQRILRAASLPRLTAAINVSIRKRVCVCVCVCAYYMYNLYVVWICTHIYIAVLHMMWTGCLHKVNGYMYIYILYVNVYVVYVIWICTHIRIAVCSVLQCVGECTYGVATVSRIDYITGLFCRI